ncbi:Exopolyphosphatase [Clostridiaceae bacterium JG1575]|nr:Exopolyphosphatase [Clostridiaceae bacterium JG1575]
MRLGIIDLGSNTVRLVVWEIYGRGFYRTIQEQKKNIRLGEQSHNPEIAEDKIEETVTTLREFRRFCENLDVGRIIVVATEAVRRAPNQKDFLARIQTETGFEPVVLCQHEEAYLDFRGVTGSMEVKNSLMVDIGGSSTELVWIKDNQMMENISVPIGTLDLTEDFELADIVKTEAKTAMEKKLLEAFSSIDWIRENVFSTMILVGGSARAIGRIERYRTRYPLTLTHNYSLSCQDIKALYYHFMTKNAATRAKTQGLERNRSDLILGALAIIHTLCRCNGLSELRISGKGLREGILHEHLTSHYDCYPSMLDASLFAIISHHNLNRDHALHVHRLAKICFDALVEKGQLDASQEDVLKCAAYLHDSGLSIRYYDHEKHSFYLILNSEINGLNHKEILLAALAARYHRKVETEPSIVPYTHLINKMDLYTAERLGLFIALGEAFDLSLSGLVYDLDCAVLDERFVLRPHASEDVSMEIHKAMKIKDKFQELFHLCLTILDPVTEQEAKSQPFPPALPKPEEKKSPLEEVCEAFRKRQLRAPSEANE